jgi:CheY-like chemotaxis protein
VNDVPQQTILVVDDEPAVLNLCKVILGRGGYRVLEARNGVDGWSVAQASPAPIELALLDVVMPGMNGFELAAKLRGLKPAPEVLLMSGYRIDEVRKIAGSDYPYRLIWKPFRADSLLQMIQTVLDGAADRAPE